MVRENKNLEPKTSKGFDQEKGPQLNEELDKAGKSTFETQFPDGEPNKEPIGIRGDATPDKEG